MGLMHAQSGTLVLDVDREAETRIALEAFQIDLDELLLGPRILSAKGAKPIFRLPPELAQRVSSGQRGLHTLKWPDPLLPRELLGLRAEDGLHSRRAAAERASQWDSL